MALFHDMCAEKWSILRLCFQTLIVNALTEQSNIMTPDSDLFPL